MLIFYILKRQAIRSEDESDSLIYSFQNLSNYLLKIS